MILESHDLESHDLEEWNSAFRKRLWLKARSKQCSVKVNQRAALN
jgi:hypothetical protein